MVYVITYSLTRGRENYEPFFAYLSDNEFTDWICDVGESCHLIESSAMPDFIRRKLIPFLIPADRLIICEMFKGACAGQLSPPLKRQLAERDFRLAENVK